MKEKIFEFIKFSIVGGIMTLISMLLFSIFVEIFLMNYILSNIISYTISVLLSYFINSRFTFNQKQIAKKQEILAIIKFFIMKIILLLLDSICLFILVDLLKINIYLSKILLTIIFYIVSYPISKFLIVIKKGEYQ